MDWNSVDDLLKAMDSIEYVFPYVPVCQLDIFRAFYDFHKIAEMTPFLTVRI